jgi:plasmid stability protein
MGRLVHIHGVPEPVHRALEARAAQAGKSLSEYLCSELEAMVVRPSAEELRERLRARHGNGQRGPC